MTGTRGGERRENDGSAADPGRLRPVTVLPFILAVSAIASLLPAASGSCLTVRDSSGDLVAAFSVGNGLEFSIRYIHSVALLPCTDFHTALPDGRIRIDGTLYAGLGAGLPSGDEGADFSLIDGEIRLDGMDRYTGSISILPSPFALHTISISAELFDLRDLIGSTGIGTISIERLPLTRIPEIVGAGYFSFAEGKP